MVHRGRAVLVAVMVVGFTLASTRPAMVEERADVTMESVLEEHALTPLGIDNTYSNWDVWVPPACRGGEWIGFQFDLPASNVCVGALYDDEDNPFASPSGKVGTGNAGQASPKADGSGTLIEWVNADAPVSGNASGPHGHFGYQYDNDDTPTTAVCPASSNIPAAAWLRDGDPCTAKKTLAMLVANDSLASGSDATRALDDNARLLVWNHSDELITIGLAAVPWPEDRDLPDTGEPLLAILLPGDPTFSAIFDGVSLEYMIIEPGRFASYSFDLPDATRVVLAKYEVTSIMGEERTAEYDAYMAFESHSSFFPLDPGPTADPTFELPPRVTDPPVTTATPTPTHVPFWNLHFPSVLYDAVATFP